MFLLITGPMNVLSTVLPTVNSLVNATAFSNTSSYTELCTMAREHAEHFWPEKPNRRYN